MPKSNHSKRASQADRDYFARIARAAASIGDEQPPSSIEEMFERLDRIRDQHGELARPGVAADDDGDLAGHLLFLAHIRRVLGRGTLGA